MSTVVAGSLFIVLLMVVIFSSLSVGIKTQYGFAVAYQTAEEKSTGIRNTAISLAGSAMSQSNSQINANLTNTGAKPIRLYKGVDVIVDYKRANGDLVKTRLTYVSSNPAAGQWSVASITPNQYNPGVLDPQEVANLEMHINPPIKNSTTGVLRVGTDAGAVAQVFFYG